VKGEVRILGILGSWALHSEFIPTYYGVAVMRRTLQLLTALIVVLGLSAGCTDGGHQQEASGSGSTRGDQQRETSGSGTNPQEARKSTGKKPLAGCVSAESRVRDPRQAAKNEDPDERIAFAAEEDYSEESTATDIYLMNADGTNRTRLTNGQLTELGPSWSPDGKKIAFTGGKEALYRATEDPESFDTYVMNADGSALTKLADDTGVSIAWSADGEKMIFSTGGSIYVMNADGTGRVSLITNLDHPSSLDWSPDCKKIAFSELVGPQGTAPGIYVMNADGTNLKRLRPAAFSPGVWNGSSDDPAWSPDGKKIAYVSEDADSVDTINVMNADGTDETTLTNYENGETGSVLSSPTWSPDGEKIAFVSDAGVTGEGGNVLYTDDIYVTEADGSGTTRLTNTPRHERTPAWTPGS
jgi:Tol biopolymer transport system component